MYFVIIIIVHLICIKPPMTTTPPRVTWRGSCDRPCWRLVPLRAATQAGGGGGGGAKSSSVAEEARPGDHTCSLSTALTPPLRSSCRSPPRRTPSRSDSGCCEEEEVTGRFRFSRIRIRWGWTTDGAEGNLYPRGSGREGGWGREGGCSLTGTWHIFESI